MKNLHLRKIFVFILMFAVLGFGCLMNYQPEVGAEETELTAEEERMQNGLTFSAKETYDTVKNLTTMPKTFEAYFNLPKTVTSRAGLLFGNIELIQAYIVLLLKFIGQIQKLIRNYIMM